jgi:hypothetical protein
VGIHEEPRSFAVAYRSVFPGTLSYQIVNTSWSYSLGPTTLRIGIATAARFHPGRAAWHPSPFLLWLNSSFQGFGGKSCSWSWKFTAFCQSRKLTWRHSSLRTNLVALLVLVGPKASIEANYCRLRLTPSIRLDQSFLLPKSRVLPTSKKASSSTHLAYRYIKNSIKWQGYYGLSSWCLQRKWELDSD